MVERAVGTPPRLDPADWRAALREWAQGLITAYLRHPWALEATVGPRPLGPHELGWMEQALTALEGTGLTGAERLDAIAVLAGHVRMIAQQAAAARDPDAQFSAGIAAVLAEHGARFPVLAQTMAAAAAEGGQDQAFEFGLDRILDGLQTLVTSRRGARH